MPGCDATRARGRKAFITLIPARCVARRRTRIDVSNSPNETRKQIVQDKRNRAVVDSKSAMAEIAAREAFVVKNTARLRELRLAKEAKEREELASAPPVAKAKAKSR
jgi:hypothetical protein